MTAAGYVTDVAYIPGFYPHLSPVAMRHVAALNGVLPPRTDAGFRVLELGCGLGRSLTTLAAAVQLLAARAHAADARAIELQSAHRFGKAA